MKFPTDLTVNKLVSELNECHAQFMKKNNIHEHGEYFVLKLLEELGEVARTLLAHRKLHPKASPTDPELNDAVADLLCQTIIFVSILEKDAKHKIDVWPMIKKKWLQESSSFK